MDESIKYFKKKNDIISQSTDLDAWYDEKVKDQLLVKAEEFQEENSDWPLIEIINLLVDINKYAPFSIGLSTYKDLPKYIQTKKAVVNIKANDPYCFFCSVTAALNHVENNTCVMSSFPHFSELLKCDNIKFPMSFSDIKKFEKGNNLSINIYCEDNEKSKKQEKSFIFI